MQPWQTRKPIVLVAALLLALLGAPALAGPYLLFDVGSGRVLAEDDAFQRWYPASLTKLMTAYVAFRAVESGEMQLDSPILMTQNAAKEPPSKMGFPPGSVLTLDNALKIILVKSANDVATAIAESIGGSEAGFAARMNAEARRLGMTDTHFVNAHGLHSPDHYSTARDLALLVRALRTEFPQFANYFALEGIRYGKSVVENHNFLIGRFEGADGMKTGYICAGGFNLIATATRGRRTLAVIVLGAHSQVERAELAADLLARGFKGFGFGLGGPTLTSLRPSRPVSPTAIDIRSQVCSQEAVAKRAEMRDDEGRFVLNSPHVRPRTHEPRLVAVGLGGASGPIPGKPVYANIPIPTPRPEYPPQTVSAGEGG